MARAEIGPSSLSLMAAALVALLAACSGAVEPSYQSLPQGIAEPSATIPATPSPPIPTWSPAPTPVLKATATAVPGPTPAPTPRPAPLPTPRTITFRQLATIREGTLIRILGDLALAPDTTCETRCLIRLSEPNHGARWANLYVDIIDGTTRTDNGVLNLPMRPRPSDLVVFTNKGARLHVGDTVWITGRVDNEPNWKVRDIDVWVIVDWE